MNKNKRTDEIKLCGLNTCLMYFKTNPQGLIRVCFEKKRQKEMKPLVEYCVKMRLAYHQVTDLELEKISESKHHEGVCILVQKPKLAKIDDLFSKKGKSLFLCLEGVENPHNLGAILRSAAHFGINGVIITKTEPHLTSSFFRVSEGGAFFVPLAFIPSMDELIKKAKSHQIQICATSSHSGEKLYEAKLPERLILVLGAEHDGINPGTLKLINKTVQIDGTGKVESLNVSVASSLLLGEWYRQHQKI